MRRLSGFSLIELMIALLIGSLLMSGVFNILVGAKQAYRVQDELSRTQENARFAADFIARDLRTWDYPVRRPRGFILWRSPTRAVIPVTSVVFKSLRRRLGLSHRIQPVQRCH